ncbi:MAG: hypothetical protein ACUVWX_03585, partial [Kiritimatiellia bacterium]
MIGKKVLRSAVVIGLAILLSGCSAFRISVREEKPMEVSPLSAKYDQQDLLTFAYQMANDIISHPFPHEGEDKPILVTLGIQNRT